ncbi:hypothetical protein QJQ45_014377, partial [Haematococcus lacustris]
DLCVLPVALTCAAVVLACRAPQPVTCSRALSSKPGTRPLQCQSCSTFVNCAWLAENLQDVSLLCCRPRPDYLDGHIPGAVHCSWQEVSGGETCCPDPDHDRFAAVVESKGVSAGRVVVLVGGRAPEACAARLWLALRAHGHPDARLLLGKGGGQEAADTSPCLLPAGGAQGQTAGVSCPVPAGGWEAWAAGGGPQELYEPCPLKLSTQFDALPQPDLIRRAASPPPDTATRVICSTSLIVELRAELLSGALDAARMEKLLARHAVSGPKLWTGPAQLLVYDGDGPNGWRLNLHSNLVMQLRAWDARMLRCMLERPLHCHLSPAPSACSPRPSSCISRAHERNATNVADLQSEPCTSWQAPHHPAEQAKSGWSRRQAGLLATAQLASQLLSEVQPGPALAAKTVGLWLCSPPCPTAAAPVEVVEVVVVMMAVVVAVLQVVLRDGRSVEVWEHGMSLAIVALRGAVPQQWVLDYKATLGKYAGFSLGQRGQLLDIFKELSDPADTKNSAAGADCVSLGDAWLAPAIQRRLLQPLPHPEQYRWWRLLPPRWHTLLRRHPDTGQADPGGQVFGAPFRWGCSLVAVRADRLRRLGGRPVRDWEDLMQPALRGRVAMTDSPREFVGVALKLLGLGWNSSAAQVAAAGMGVQALAASCRALRGQVKLLSSRDHVRALVAGDVLAVVGWSQDLITLAERTNGVQALVPASGTALWADLWVLPRGDLTGPWRQGPSPLLSSWFEFNVAPARHSSLGNLKTGATPSLLPESTSHDVQLRPADSAKRAEAVEAPDVQHPRGGSEATAAVDAPGLLSHASRYMPLDMSTLERSEFLLPLDDATLQLYSDALQAAGHDPRL